MSTHRHAGDMQATRRHYIATADLAQLLLCEVDEKRPGALSVLTSDVTRVKWRVFDRLPENPVRREFHIHLAMDLAQDVLFDAA